jgi:hypothetical protein
MRKIIKVLLDLAKEKMLNFIKSKRSIYLDFGDFRNCCFINEENNIYSHPMSANTVRDILQILFEYFGFIEDDLKIYVK